MGNCNEYESAINERIYQRLNEEDNKYFFSSKHNVHPPLTMEQRVQRTHRRWRRFQIAVVKRFIVALPLYVLMSVLVFSVMALVIHVISPALDYLLAKAVLVGGLFFGVIADFENAVTKEKPDWRGIE